MAHRVEQRVDAERVPDACECVEIGAVLPLTFERVAEIRIVRDEDHEIPAVVEDPAGVRHLAVDALGCAPAAAEPVAEPAAAPTQVIIQPGNNLWKLSRQIYGKGVMYTVIYEANKDQIRRPELIYPGQIFLTPEAAAATTGQ